MDARPESFGISSGTDHVLHKEIGFAVSFPLNRMRVNEIYPRMQGSAFIAAVARGAATVKE